MKHYPSLILYGVFLLGISMLFPARGGAQGPASPAGDASYLDCRLTDCTEEQLILALCGSACFRTAVLTPVCPKPLMLSVEFGTNATTILPEHHAELDKLARVLKLAALQHTRIRAIGHTDDRGPRHQNQLLSEARAEAVKEYLVKRHGLQPEWIETQGLGERRSLESNKTEEGRRINRRVEITSVSP